MKSVTVSALAFIVAVCALASWAQVRAAGQQPTPQVADGIAPEALEQIAALLAEKQSRSAAEQKIDSQLLYEQKMEAGEPLATGVWAVETDLPYAGDGHVVVDVHARAGSNLAARLAAAGLEVVSASGDGSTLRMHLDIDEVRAVAADADVLFIAPRQDAVTTGFGQQPEPNIVAGPTGVGSRSSEGDITHLAFAARGAFHVDGTGVKIGVLSDGVRNLAESQRRGDLGPVTVIGPADPCLSNVTCDEGTAMLEIIHDLAPGAQLYFASAFESITNFAANIRALRDKGCDIIVDDVLYFVETPFQDGQAPTVNSNRNSGIVMQAVNDVTADGALYFSSAGNSGNVNAGTSGVWEGNFVDGGGVAAPLVGLPPLEPLFARLHSFGGQTFNVLNAPGLAYNLYWSDPLGASSNDYDLFRLNPAGTAVVALSTNFQTGTQDPYEEVTAARSVAGERLVVVKYAGDPRFLHLNTNRGRLSIATAGQTHGHNSAAAAFSVAATPAQGPFPGIFNASNTVEPFSSDGPRRLFYRADGTPYTPGNVLATGGIVRQKPDITAADGVSVTGVGAFPSPFFGTSAAAPHAAAIAALVKSANPTLTASQIRSILTNTAIDIEAPGTDRDSGAGIIMARDAVSATGATGTAYLAVERVQASDNPGNGNGFPEAGEGARMTVTLKNYGVQPATNISASLGSTTTGITVATRAKVNYPDLAPLASAASDAPLLFTTASDFGCGGAANFTFKASYNGEVDALTQAVAVPIGAIYSITHALNGSTPPRAPGVTPSAGVQLGRLFRDGVASTCGAQKAINTGGARNPVDASGRFFDAYQFNTCANSGPSCATVTLQGSNAVSLFSAAYAPTFNRTSILDNYKADPGSSSSSRTYSFDVPAGPQTFVIDVHDVPLQNPPVPSGNPYTLTVSGICAGSCDPPNRPPVARAKNVTAAANDVCVADASVDDGSSDPDGDIPALVQSPAGPYAIGTTSVLLTATDWKGAFSEAVGAVEVVDRTPPSISCPAPISATTASGQCSARVAFAPPSASDLCSSPVAVSTSVASGASFPLGTTTITGKATDAAGNDAFCTTTVTVVDKEPPSIVCPAPITVPTAPGLCSAPVTFALPKATDACSTPVVSTSIAPGSSFPLGTTTVTGKATDASGNDAVCATSVIVVDQEPPTVSALSVSSAEPLWPPNHRMVDVTVGYGASDNCGGSSCVLSVSSNEPVTAAGDDNTAPDWEVVDAHHVRLRAERSNAGIGRTYTITLTCTDAAGNRTVRSATVFVPHDRRTTG